MRRTFRLHMLLAALVTLCVGFAGTLHASDNAQASSTLAERVRQLPPFDSPTTDGLYATITFAKSFDKVNLDDDENLKLKGIAGFPKEVKVLATLQDGPAPLAIPLLGLTMKNKDELAKLIQAQLYESGCHVVSFDSIFRTDMGKRTMHGVAGCFEAEAEAVVKIIAAVLQHEKLKGKVTEVRLLGASYGGTLACHIQRQLRAEGAPFRVSCALLLSPTVNMKTSARLLDEYYERDFGIYKHDRMKLLPLRGHEPVEAGRLVPFKPELMKAGIGYVFRDELKKVVKENDKLYKLGILKQTQESDAGKWTFQQYVREMATPYWQSKGKVRDENDFWHQGDLKALLTESPWDVVTVIASDDPLNDSQEVEAFKAALPNEKLILLPHGGHLGYLGTAWFRALIQSAFK